MPAAYRPTAANGATDDYRCFLLDRKLTSDAFVTSAQIAPGATSLVHHVILYRLVAGAVAEATALDARTAGPGWTCFGGPGVGNGTTANPRGILDDAGWISAWAPGWGSDRLRDGTGISLPAGFTAGPTPLPIGIQLLGPVFSEPTLLRAARMYESATDWHTRRPKLA
jgi:hypothetical protein